MKEISIHTDGASRGNPGAAAIAYTIDGLTPETIDFAETIGVTTNNQAEYQAMLKGLTFISSEITEPTVINCFADSELVVKQVTGVYRMKDALLRPHFEKIVSLVSQLERQGSRVSFTAVRRADNKRADQLCNQALDGEI